MDNEVALAIFIYGIFSGVMLSIAVIVICHINYFKVKNYFKISFREYLLLDTHTKNELTDSANHKLHKEILKRTEKEN